MHITTYTNTEFKKHLQESNIFYAHHETAAGLLLILATKKGIFSVTFVDAIKDYPEYHKKDDLDLNQFLLVGTEFQINVWNAALQIPAGKVVSYQDVATRIGKPTAYRAVALALKNNKIAYFVPCHRVLLKSGELCGYNWGVERKRLLLEAEKNK